MVKRNKYDSGLARRKYLKKHNIKEERWICRNPDCQRILPVDELEIHHLLPRRIAPSLKYDVSNMVLICPECHREIEKTVLKNKLEYQEKKIVFCDICGFVLFGRRDRFGKKVFHHHCFLSKLYDKKFMSDLIRDDLIETENCNHKWKETKTFRICLICGVIERLQ